MNKLPVVSVVMITYNHQNYIEQAVNSILMQESDFDFELIISNDKSPDDTNSIINKILAEHPKAARIKYLNHENNVGMHPNFLRGLAECSGRYIALCEGDDYWTDPLKLQKQVDFMEKNDKYVICHHDSSIIDQFGNELSKSKLNGLHADFTSLQMELGDAFILTNTALFRNVKIDFPEAAFKIINGDSILWHLLGRYGDSKFLNSVGNSVYRSHPGGVWSEKNIFSKYQSLIVLRNFLLSRLTGEKKKMEYALLKEAYASAVLIAVKHRNKAQFKKIMSDLRRQQGISFLGTICALPPRILKAVIRRLRGTAEAD